MRGFPVGYCTTSTVDPVKGLFYVGKSIDEIAGWEPEKVIYLLYYGKEGSADQIRQFSQELDQRSKCSPELIRQINSLPKQGHPMKLFLRSFVDAGGV